MIFQKSGPSIVTLRETNHRLAAFWTGRSVFDAGH